MKLEKRIKPKVFIIIIVLITVLLLSLMCYMSCCFSIQSVLVWVAEFCLQYIKKWNMMELNGSKLINHNQIKQNKKEPVSDFMSEPFSRTNLIGDFG